MVGFSAYVAHLGKGIADLNVPHTAALLGAIDAFLKPEDIALGDVETRRCFHVYFFLKVGIEISGLDIHLMYFKVVFSSEGKNGVEGREFGNGGEGLIEVNAFDLSETLSNDVGLVLLYTAVGTMFDTKDPFAAYNFVAFQPRDNVVDVQVLPSMHFFFAGGKPLGGVWTSHSLVIHLQLRGLSIGDIGMALIRGNTVARVIIWNGRASGAFRMRGRERNWRGSRKNGRKNGRSRRWSVVRFEDNVLVAQNWAPLIKYDITRL
jgi:hypothetical protein